MADESKWTSGKGGWFAGIASAIIIAVVAGTSRPWWMGGAKPEPKPGVPVVAKSEPLTPDFLLGRWTATQSDGTRSYSAESDFFKDGQFQGTGLQVVGQSGEQVKLVGTWGVSVLSDNLLRLTLRLDGHPEMSWNYKVLDKNHIQNLDNNYVSERLE